MVPILTLFLFGIVQFGIAYDMKQSVNSAAREGARMAAIPDDANVLYSFIRARVDASFNSLDSEPVGEVLIDVIDAADPNRAVLESFDEDSDGTPCGGYPGETVVVTVIQPHRITIPFFGVRDVDLSGRGEFRCEIDA